MSTYTNKGAVVRYWPGSRRGNSYYGTLIDGEQLKFGGTDCLRIRKEDGGSDYLAVTHVQLVGRLEGRTMYVQTAQEALAVCEMDGIDDVVIEDNAERIKFQKLMRAFR